MKYEELLEKLNDKYIVFFEPDSVFNFYKKQSDALREVVELHSIIEISYGGKVPVVLCDWCRVDYPCRTISVIEKALS